MAAPESARDGVCIAPDVDETARDGEEPHVAAQAFVHGREVVDHALAEVGAAGAGTSAWNRRSGGGAVARQARRTRLPAPSAPTRTRAVSARPASS